MHVNPPLTPCHHRAIKVLLKRRLPIDPKLGTYFKNFVVKNGRMHLAYTHLTDPRLTHPNFRASANGCVATVQTHTYTTHTVSTSSRLRSEVASPSRMHACIHASHI